MNSKGERHALRDALELLDADPDHRVIVARRDLLVALALTGFAAVAACGGREENDTSGNPGAGGVVATASGGQLAGGSSTGGTYASGATTAGAWNTGGNATGGWLGIGGLEGLVGTGGEQCNGCGCNGCGCT